MEIKLTKDDYYEIEKILDNYSGILHDCLVKYCNTAINLDGLKAIKSKPGSKLSKNPLDNAIKEIQDSEKRVKAIRDKLEVMRGHN